MSANDISIAKYLELKGGSIDELCEYAQSKGVNLPEDSHYCLSLAELKLIDPIFVYQQKFSREVSAVNKVTDDQTPMNVSSIFDQIDEQTEAIKYSHPSLDQSYTSANSQNVQSPNAEDIVSSSVASFTPKNCAEKKKTPKRLIGIVKFFDSSKDFGFIVTNSKGISGRPEDEKRLYNFYISSAEWNSSSFPQAGEWVVLTPQRNRNKWNAVDVRRLSYDKASLISALKYRGKYAKIEGTDTHSSETYNYNILCHIIDELMQKCVVDYHHNVSKPLDKTRYQEVVSAFCEYLSRHPAKQQVSIINQFTSDDELKTLLAPMFLQIEYENEDKEQKDSYINFRDNLLDSILSPGTIQALDSLPDEFDLSNCHDKVVQILSNESLSNKSDTESWLRNHSEIIGELNLNGNDLSTLPLRVVLSQVTNKGKWISKIRADWHSICQFINSTPSFDKIGFLELYFAHKDSKFVADHELRNILSIEEVERWTEQIINLKNKSLSYLLKSFMDSEVGSNICLIQNYIDQGYDIPSIYATLRNALNIEIKENASEVRFVLDDIVKHGISMSELFPWDIDISDEMRLELFVRTGNHQYLNGQDNFEPANAWITNQPADFVASLIKRYGPLIKEGTADDALITSLGEATISKALKAVKEKEQLQLLEFFTKDLATSVISDCFSETKLFEVYIGKLLKELKDKLTYVVFDLESDGDKVQEFAFKEEGHIYYYKDEGQLSSLINALNSTSIIVGHRIKQWDLEILNHLSSSISSAFVWDTLEIEILLNPCRYAYSLHTTHNAIDDTDLTDRLFWNQLFRLAMDEELCRQLSDFLPSNISQIMGQLRKSYFIKYFEQYGETESSFYQSLNDVEEDLASKLSQIEQESTEDKKLIIAPKRLWNRIAEHISLSFIRDDNGIDFLPISKEKLKDKPLKDYFLQAVLLRFCELSKTPIYSNLASYLRIQYFNEEMLLDYVEEKVGKIQCADLPYIYDLDRTFEFEKLYFIGCELENRLNQYTLPTPLYPSDFWNERSSIPMRLGGSSYTALTSEDRRSVLFSDIPDEASNAWVEKTCDGRYLVSYNLNFHNKLELITSKKENHMEVHDIPWFSDKTDNSSVYLVRSGRSSKFDFLQKRVNSTTQFRSMYWMYQLALLKDIHSANISLPIIYILEDDLELDQVKTYAKSIGFYIPPKGSLITRLEKIAQKPNGLIVVSKVDFFKITEKRLYQAYCYVWDQMAVEKHQIMWQNSETSVGESALNDSINEVGDELMKGSNKDTYQASIISTWPIYQYYSRFILANNKLSRMYILDSFLEEYHTMSSVWHTNDFTSSSLWSDEATYNSELKVAQAIFNDINSVHSPTDQSSIKQAMNVILETLVPKSGDKERKWSEVQAKVLPEILSKQENYLISIPTGGGKSILFQGPALYKASYTNKLSLVVTPLKALMQDQVRDLSKKGFHTNVDFLNGDRTYQETRSIYRKINSGELAILYVTPERFRSRGFLNALMTRMGHDNGLEYMIFDEAHCICQWGMEFRPEYLNVIKMCNKFSSQFPGKVCFAMFSATVTDMIYKQINAIVPVKRLGQDCDQKTYNPIRSHIGTSFQRVNHDIDSRINAIVAYIKVNKIDFTKSRMLVFCRTRKQCEELADKLPSLLLQEGVLQDNNPMERVGYFHAGLDAEDRDYAYSRFKAQDDPIYILCATKAFGMGMDIPNIHYIVHLSPPSVLEDYLQEVGRAGRNKDMYELVGFNPQHPIPTVCLYSTDDIKKSRELLLQSMLSWKNLEEIRLEILKYIEGIQPIEKTRKIPIVIPNNLWKSSENDFEYTSFKLGWYWLERMNRVKMGYLRPAHINITVSEQDPSSIAALSSQAGNQTKKVYAAIAHLVKEKGNKTIQVSLQNIASDLSIHTSKVLNELISCVNYKLISINQEVHCRIANTRRDEVTYLLKNKEKELALHIILNATIQILEDNVLNKEKTYFDKDIKAFINLDSLEKFIKPIPQTIGNKENTTKYMPWYKEEEKGRNKGLSIATNYKRDLLVKRFRQIFVTLLDLTPGVKCKSYIDKESRAVKQSILIERNTWKTFLPRFKEDCLTTLTYIYNLQERSIDHLNWADAINFLKFEDRGFDYFGNIIRYLAGMAYIVTENLLPMGMDVCCTEMSQNPILENVSSESKDYEHKKAFDEAIQIRSLRLCVMDALTSKIKTKEQFQELISAYFSKTDANGFIELLGKYYTDSDSIWDTIRETAIKAAEEKMKDNQEQWNIYSESSNTSIDVEAGPGSGKTHVLTMRCAKLIYHQHVRPDQILVLAYNRAVIVELRSRLAKLFTSLGLSRSAAQLHVYTFHGLAKKICGDNTLEGLEMSDWESTLLDLMRNTPSEVTKVFSDIRYILIDEFQDITQTRLEAIFELNKIYKHPAFFTIGDKDQSIYGFEKKESMDPNYYYKQLYEKIKPKRMTMSTNYRSYPKILTSASSLLSSKSKMPVPCKKNRESEPQEEYTFIYNDGRNWVTDFQSTILYLKEKKMTDVAIFFRTNNEVYRGYSMIRSMNILDIRLRIQGASECELFRKREIYAVIHMLESLGNKRLKLEDDTSKDYIKSKISSWISKLPNWDSFYLDFAYTLVLDYLNFASGDEEQHTYMDMAESIRQSLSEDNPQLYKLYDQYQSQRILQDNQMNVVLTTMHKIKGLEFDAVIITPSTSSLPFDPNQNIDVEKQLTPHEKECIEEEQRLLYVAFTRAKKFLVAYLGKRENAVLNMQKYIGEDETLGIRERNPGLDNYNIGYNADYNYINNRTIVNSIAKNAPVSIQRRDLTNKRGEPFSVFNIVCNGITVGQLSKSSSIARAMKISGQYTLDGYFVSDVYYWTYEDSVLADRRSLRVNGYQTDYASKWSEEAKSKGFIFIVGIAGYGN